MSREWEFGEGCFVAQRALFCCECKIVFREWEFEEGCFVVRADVLNFHV